jgi:hypothetical protein
MQNPILRLLVWVLACLTPSPRGRHRALSHTGHPSTPASPQLRCYNRPLADNASALERRRQRARRRAHYPATLGIDAGPTHIGVRVPAAAR